MTQYLTPGELIGSLPDTRADTLHVIVLPRTPDSTLAWRLTSPTGVSFPATRVRGMTTRELADHVRNALPTDRNCDLVVVVISDERPWNRPPLRAAIAALEADLSTTGHTVLGRYWAPHTRPGAPWRDYRRPTHLGTVIAPRADLDFAAPVQLGGDAPTPTWGLPFTDTGETLPAHLGRFARRVVPQLVRRGDEAGRIVAHAIVQAGRGELVDDIAAFAVTTALADNAVYGPMLLPPNEHDPQRVEQLWMALHRGSRDPAARARLATLIAASAVRRGERHLTACALAHGAPGAATVGLLFQQHAAAEVVEQQLDQTAGQVGALPWVSAKRW
ncbi:DUF4192 family protein [Amycolatopsis sp. DG1A-15b]|uniref:DUF4192 family protein n=1 Tax=Amycolatopsis sp. DG1A-15b TaxID=3052846 RepID=UPI00255BF5F2|nr:DUF4192 family protein [Amycolatopsis sp. DG1A-15b]WIX85760.1 DUF4192 family protein [Amycolatopsis sp. DG1A-15b]